MTRCKSNYCITQDGVKGRLFTPPDGAEGLALSYCPDCIKLGNQLIFYSQRTAQMVKRVYKEYADTALPKEVLLILEQFVTELLKELNDKL